VLGVYGYSAYCASKHAIHGLTGALRMELAPQNIRVHLVCPPEFESPMVDALNQNRSEENRAIATTIPPMRAEAVADAILRGLRREQYEIVVGTPARLVRLGDRLLPALSRHVADRKLAKLRRREAAR
jgi:3-dehydrosphinganine reductase